MTNKEEVELLWSKLNAYKETAEQHMFPVIAGFDLFLIPAYNDLQKNWSDKHAEIFIRSLKAVVFPKLGIELEE